MNMESDEEEEEAEKRKGPPTSRKILAIQNFVCAINLFDYIDLILPSSEQRQSLK